jgi:catechol 2,3-dioxygenase-like lactoylglutathione lyase family enzyme
MNPCIHVITLGVEDLHRSFEFYRSLGWESPGIIGTEFAGDDHTPGGAAAMFELQGGLILALYARDDLAKDSTTAIPPPPAAFSLGHLAPSREAVDEVLATAQAAGATLTDRPHTRPWGIYSGYFRDPDGHLWEVIWNPALGSSPATEPHHSS